MIPLPAIPTDNLYKFASIAGIILIVASYVLIGLDLLETRREMANRQDKLDVMQDELAHVKLASDNVSNHRLQIDLLKIKAENVAKLNDISIRVWDDRAKMFQTLSRVGIGIAFFGLLGWLTRVQLHHDKIVRLDVEIKTLEMKTQELDFQERQKAAVVQATLPPEAAPPTIAQPQLNPTTVAPA